jgi:hypothetical protein
MEGDVNLNQDSRLKVGELPDLKIMPIKDIIFHEEPDLERSSTLKIFIQKEGKLKNPPVVAYYEGYDHYILLDGANRITALKELDVKDVLVQQLDLFDPDLLFLHWHHAVEKFTRGEFPNKLNKIQYINMENTTRNEIDFQHDGQQLCQIQFANECVYSINTDGDLFRKVDILNEITNIYRGFAYMDRVSYTNLAHLREHYPDFCALVCFKKFTKEELIQIVQNNKKLPSGITRIILPKRALRLNVPLDILRFEAPIEEKNHWLQERINLQVKDKSIRFYYEPAFLFDE